MSPSGILEGGPQVHNDAVAAEDPCDLWGGGDRANSEACHVLIKQSLTDLLKSAKLANHQDDRVFHKRDELP
jgi:hypothetical protein